MKNTNGYVVYPSCTGVMSLRAAKRLAKAESQKEPGYARVENCDTEKVMVIYRWGDQEAK